MSWNLQKGLATLCCSASSSCLQLYWARFLLRKWFNISTTESDHNVDTDDEEDDDSAADSDIEGKLLIFTQIWMYPFWLLIRKIWS